MGSVNRRLINEWNSLFLLVIINLYFSKRNWYSKRAPKARIILLSVIFQTLSVIYYIIMCFTLIIPWSGLIIYVSIFDLILLLSLLHYTSSWYWYCYLVNASLLFPKKEPNRYYIFFQIKPCVEEERTQKTFSQCCLRSCFLEFMTGWLTWNFIMRNESMLLKNEWYVMQS